MSRATSKPGPPPTSCFTCRRRRKKCDLSRPYCERCLKGGFECLGYGGSGYPARTHRGQPSAQVPSQPSVTPTRVISQTPDCFPVGSSEHLQTSNDIDSRMDCDTRSSIMGAALLYRMNELIASNNEDRITSADSSEDLNYSWPQDQNRLAVYPHSPTRQPARAARLFDLASTPSTKSINHDLCSVIKVLCRSVPPSVDATQMMKENHFAHVTNDCE
ncbi:hypothetical protein B0J17DRAFT_683055 [Rhizoctonia solani]|nr:hypothetical protein B0J17DRAFT_683055 [Rhizoctonia solani]